MTYSHRFDASSAMAQLKASLDGDDVMISIIPRAGAAITRHLPIAPEAIFRQSVARHLLARLADADLAASCTDGIVAEFSNLLPER